MIHFFYTILKYVFILLFSTTLLFMTFWNLPQTHDEMVRIKEFVEEQYDIDIDKINSDFTTLLNRYRGVKR